MAIKDRMEMWQKENNISMVKLPSIKDAIERSGCINCVSKIERQRRKKMGLTKTDRVVELSQNGSKILATLHCDNKTYQEWIESLEAKGYTVNEVQQRQEEHLPDKETSGEDEEINNPCADIVSMVEWLKGEAGDDCRSCLLPPVIQWYVEELRDNGQHNLAQELEDTIESNSSVATVEKLDEIMESVPDNLKERLKDFNCAIQTYDESEDTE